MLIFLKAAPNHEVIVDEKDDFGHRYNLDFEVTTELGTTSLDCAC